jgi:crotonobetainyl-CoA:carnitine CoA-transferase CaiB-like acyl-CoA transferase
MRYRNMVTLVSEIDDILADKSRDEWGQIFDSVGLIWGPVLTLDEVATDPQAEAIGMFPEIEHPERGRYRSVRAPMRFRDAEVQPRGPAPTLGEHTRAVLTDAGLSAEEIDALIAQGAIRAE